MPDPKLVAELAPTGVLRAAINMGNFLLVTGKAPNGDPTGVSPDMALAIGARLGVPVKFIPYARPGEIADDAEKGVWDIGNIGAEPQRAAVISFTAAYAEIEATYFVPAGSPIKAIAEVGPIWSKPTPAIADSATGTTIMPIPIPAMTTGTIRFGKYGIAPLKVDP